MKKQFIFTIIALFVFCNSGVSQVLDSESFKPLAQVEEKIGDGYSAAKIITTVIHPTTTINYPDNNITLENELKNQYDLVLINISGLSRSNSFSIYEFKNSALLQVDGKRVECVEFYDFKISSSSYAYFSEYTFNYTSSSNSIISGYLMFPKTINGELTKSVELKYANKTVSWNFNKITKMIEILK